MKSKRLICIALLLLILCIGAVSAANETDTLSDNDDKAITEENDEILSISQEDENDEILSISQEDEKLDSSYDFTGTTFDELQDAISEDYRYTINLKNDVKQTGNETIVIDKPMYINGNGHTIDAAGKSRIFLITSKKVILNNITFINGISGDDYEGNGGAVCFNDTSDHAEITNCIFENNTAKERGGAIWVDDNDYKITNSKFINNKAGYGGAVYVRHETEINNCQFISNTATYSGGAVYCDTTYEKITNSAFANNKAPTGGAVYWISSKGEVNNSTFENNTATEEGGAIFWYGTSEKMTSCNFTGNNAKNGGAVYVYDTSTNGQIIDCRFTQNNATEKGGSINWQGANGKITNTLFTNNHANDGGANAIIAANCEITNCQFSKNDADKGGANAVSGANCTISNCQFSKNNAFYGGANAIAGVNCTISNCQIANQTTTYGGGAYWEASNGKITNTTFTNNTANYGGAVYWTNAAENSMISNCTFTNNWVKKTGRLDSTGGAVHLDGNNGTITQSTFTNNTSTDYGGAVYINECNKTNISRCNFTANGAEHGGAIFVSDCANTYISVCRFTNNTATESGGAIYDDVVNHNNTADSCVFKTDSDTQVNINILPPKFSVDNFSELNNSGKKLKINFTTDRGASLGEEIVEIQIYQNNENIRNVTCLASESWTVNLDIGLYTAVCKVPKFNAGPVNITIAVLPYSYTILNRTINSNQSQEIYLDQDYYFNPIFDSKFKNGINITRSLILNGKGHTIDGKGLANIFNVQSDNVTLINMTFTNGNAKEGGAIYWKGENGTVYNSTFTNNTATEDGGAIYWYGNNGKVAQTTITNNTAKENGGAIYWYGENGTIIQTTIKDNTAYEAICICCESYEGTIENSTFYNNCTYDICNEGRLILKNNTIYSFISNYGEILSKTTITILNNSTVISKPGNINLTAVITDDSNNTIISNNFAFRINDTDINATYDKNGTFYAVKNFNKTGILTVSAAKFILSDVEIYTGTLFIAGDFEILQKMINDAETGSTINLTRNYTYTIGEDTITQGILINKDVTVNGNGYTIDAKGQSRIFKITSTATLENITLINGNATDEGGAVHIDYNAGSVTIKDSTFKNNTAVYGGAVYWYSEEGEIINCQFTNNTANFGGAVRFSGANIYNSTFTENTGKNYGGAISSESSNSNVYNSTFIKNKAGEGGAIYWNADNILIADSTFKENTANYGGAIYRAGAKGVLSNSTFTNNNAPNGGAVYNAGEYTIKDSTFKNNNISEIYNDGKYATLTLENNTVSKFIYNNNKILSKVNIKVLDNSTMTIDSNTNVNLTAVIKDDNNNIIIQEKGLKFQIDTENITATNENGIYKANKTFNTVGTYTISATSTGLENVEICTQTIIVAKSSPAINMTVPESIPYNKTANITITLPANARGNVTVSINDKSKEFILNDEFNGTLTYEIPILNAGNYTVKAVYSGDDNYLNNTNASDLKVTKLDVDFSITPANATDYNKTVIIGVSPDEKIEGEFIATVYDENGTKTNASINYGRDEITIEGLNAGTYTVNITYVPDDTINYNSVTKNTTVTVNKIDANFTIVPANATKYNETVIIGVALDEGIEGELNATVYDENGTKTNASINYGRDEITIEGLNVGTYTVNIISIPDDATNYNNVTKTTTVTIIKADAEFNITKADNVTYGEDVVINITTEVIGEFDVDAYDKNTGKEANITVTLEENAIIISGLKIGNYTINITHAGDNPINYNNVTKSVNISVKNPIEDLNFEIPEIITGKETNITITLPEETTGNMTLTVDGNVIGTANFTNGTATVTVPANITSGNHTITLNVNTNFGEKTQTQNITVTYAILKASDMTRGYNSGLDFQAKLVTSTGNPIAGETVTFTINGKKYTAVTDANGIAKLNAKLAVGTYKVTVSDNLNSNTATATAKIVARLTGSNLNMFYKDGSKLKLRVYGDDGKAVGAGQKVTIKIAGKTYTVKTDKNGYVYLPITAKLKKNTKTVKYTASATYKGFTLKKTVKIKPILKYKTQKIKKSKKTNKIKVSLKKALKGKTIKLKIKGKTLKAKTNKKGVATFKIPKKVVKKLKTGKKYKIKIKYGSSKLIKKVKVKK